MSDISKIPLEKALDQLSSEDPVFVLYQPNLGNVSFSYLITQEEAKDLLTRAPGIEESGPLAQEKNLGMFVLMAHEELGLGNLFFTTKPKIKGGQYDQIGKTAG